MHRTSPSLAPVREGTPRSMSGRYTPRSVEGEFEPGSRGRVLRNLQGIKSVHEMARVESDALLAATARMIDTTARDQRFTADDICNLHRVWLGKIYHWAGQYRQLNIASGDFMFAASSRIPQLMQSLDHGALRHFTPCRFETVKEHATALAVVHAELILIHPFRDGNGRCARLLSVLMGLQAGLPALDFGGIHGAERRRYIAAVHAAVAQNYEPMTTVFRKVIKRTLRIAARD